MAKFKPKVKPKAKPKPLKRHTPVIITMVSKVQGLDKDTFKRYENKD